jgi:hypothetical protein
LGDSRGSSGGGLRRHLHFLVTEGGVDKAGLFHKVPRLDDSRLAELFGREVLADLVGREVLSSEWAERLLSFDDRTGRVSYRYGKEANETERMDYLEFIARVTSHIPDKGQVTVRYYGLYANAHRGKVKKASLVPFSFRILEEKFRPIPTKGWAEMIRKVYEIDPLVCPQCGGQMRVIAYLTDYAVVDRIIDHLKLSFVAEGPSCETDVAQEFPVALPSAFPAAQGPFKKDARGREDGPPEHAPREQGADPTIRVTMAGFSLLLVIFDRTKMYPGDEGWTTNSILGWGRFRPRYLSFSSPLRFFPAG